MQWPQTIFAQNVHTIAAAEVFGNTLTIALSRGFPNR